MADLFKGEQQKNVDFAFLQALKTTAVAVQLLESRAVEPSRVDCITVSCIYSFLYYKNMY